MCKTPYPPARIGRGLTANFANVIYTLRLLSPRRCWLRELASWYVYAHRSVALAAEGNFKDEGFRRRYLIQKNF